MSTTLTTSSDGVFTLCLNGRFHTHAAIRTLWDDLRQLEAAQQQLETRREVLRDQLRQIATQLGHPG